MPESNRTIRALLLLGAVALTACASTESDAPVSLSMAPANDSTETGSAGSETVSLSLPESTEVLPTRSALIPEDDAVAAEDAPAPATTSMAGPTEPVSTAKQDRLPVAKSGLRTSQAQAQASSLASDTDEGEVKVAALSEQPRKTSLAQSAVSLVSFVKPDEPKSDLDGLIEKYAELYDVPVSLVRRVVKRESNFRPSATNRGHYGLMQIKPATARSMGYRGSARGLLDAETNLRYAVKYLRGAYLVADGNHDRADRLYQSGYYYHAKRKGLLEETGLGKDRRRRKP